MSQRAPMYRRPRFWGLLGALTGVLAIAAASFAVSPRPAARLIRAAFQRDAGRVLAAMVLHEPGNITSLPNQAYRPGDPDALLDAYFPEATTGTLPTVFWVHGGGWISGGQVNNGPYFKLLAHAGYTVIGVNYSLGPNRTYPTAVHQLNDALTFLVENAERLHVDSSRIVFAGDSAGAQLATQLSTLTTNPAYAAELEITPALTPQQLRGVILNCGVYDITAIAKATGLAGWGVEQSLWAYTGLRDFVDSVAGRQMSTIHHVTAEHPPVYISGGNADPLTDSQSKPMAETLSSLGVDVTPLFWPADHTPGLPHEYQFNLDTTEGQEALAATLQFLSQRLADQ